jgi:hypothetical protein
VFRSLLHTNYTDGGDCGDLKSGKSRSGTQSWGCRAMYQFLKIPPSYLFSPSKTSIPFYQIGINRAILSFVLRIFPALSMENPRLIPIIPLFGKSGREQNDARKLSFW